MIRGVFFVCFVMNLCCLSGFSEPSKKNSALRKVEAVHFMPKWWWQERHQAIKERALKNDISLLFVGDSITNMMFQKYPKGDTETRPLWEKTFGSKSKYNAANFGVSGCKTENVLWQIENNYGKSKPKVISLLIGTNNLHAAKNSPEEVAEGIKEIVKSLQKWSPKSKIILHAILPRSDYKMSKATPEIISRVNKKIKKLAKNKSITFLDLSEVLGEKGEIIPKYYDKDKLHLSLEGYKKWYEKLLPLIKRLYK